jgi:hypothetical protein
MGKAMVQWGELSAVYGPAEWVPEALRGLLDPDPDVWSTSIDWLGEGTFHHQTADEATPHVVPFLIEVASDPSGEVRSEVMYLLGLIAAGLALDRPERVRAVALLRAGRSDPLFEKSAEPRSRRYG